LFFSWDKVGVGKFDGLIGEGTFDPVAVVWELAETGAWVAVSFGSESGA